LKDVESELAGLLKKSDRTLENDIAIQGITSIKAGPIALTFKDEIYPQSVIPLSVISLMPASWFEDERIERIGTPFLFRAL
jgi:hypothetical protein